MRVFNGSLVGLGVLDDRCGAKPSSVRIEAEGAATSETRGPLRVLCDSSFPMLASTSIDCVGLGIVRGIDVAKGQLLVLLPPQALVPEEALARVNVLLKGVRRYVEAGGRLRRGCLAREAQLQLRLRE